MIKGLELLQQYRCPRWEEFPNIDLYMDQVLTFLNKHLEDIFRLNNEKVLTGSMVNNYVKHGIVEKPVKKKYNRTHLAYLYVLCLFKKVYSMEEISSLMKMQIEISDIENAYNTFCTEMEACIFNLFHDEKKYIDNNTDGAVKLLREVIQSVVSSLYVEATIYDKTHSS
jgi:Domain of unknown function (DUF1836).